VVVIEPRGGAAHEFTCDLPERRVKDEAPVVAVFLPAAEVLDEAPGIICTACDLGARTRLPKVGVNTGAQELNMLARENLPQAYRAVFLECVDVAGCDPHTVPAFTSTIFSGSMCFLMALFT
jgi:hypothetical protein